MPTTVISTKAQRSEVIRALHPATESSAKLRALCVKALAIVFALLLAHHADAQGCAQCLDNTRATPPAVQAAYRHAIFLLAGFAAALFVAGTLLLRRNR